MNLRKSYRNVKRRLRKKTKRSTKRRVGYSKVLRGKRRLSSRRRTKSRRNRQRGGYQTTSVSSGTTSVSASSGTTPASSVNDSVQTTQCSRIPSNSNVFQSTFEPVNSNSNINNVNDYLLLNNDGNYIKMI